MGGGFVPRLRAGASQKMGKDWVGNYCSSSLKTQVKRIESSSLEDGVYGVIYCTWKDGTKI